MKQRLAVVVLIALVVLLAPNANAQLVASQTVGVTVNVSVNSNITLTQSGGALNFNPTTGVTNSITFTAAYNIGPATNISLYTWFSNSASALSGAQNVPSSALSATWTSSNGSGSAVPCNQTPGISGVVDGAACATVTLASFSNGDLSNISANTGTTTATYSLALLNYAGLRLAAGTYTGVLNALAWSI